MNANRRNTAIGGCPITNRCYQGKWGPSVNTKARTGLSIHQSSKDMVVDCWKATIKIKKKWLSPENRWMSPRSKRFHCVCHLTWLVCDSEIQRHLYCGCPFLSSHLLWFCRVMVNIVYCIVMVDIVYFRVEDKRWMPSNKIHTQAK